jgi:hypothetical protein
VLDIGAIRNFLQKEVEASSGKINAAFTENISEEGTSGNGRGQGNVGDKKRGR